MKQSQWKLHESKINKVLLRLKGTLNKRRLFLHGGNLAKEVFMQKADTPSLNNLRNKEEKIYND